MANVVIDAEETSKRIKKLCMDNGYTVEDVKKALGLASSQSVYKWFSEKNASLPTIDHLVMLAKMLECSLDDLIVVKSNKS